MNENGDLFVSDRDNQAVKRWRKGAKGKGTEEINSINYIIRYLSSSIEKTHFISQIQIIIA